MGVVGDLGMEMGYWMGKDIDGSPLSIDLEILACCIKMFL